MAKMGATAETLRHLPYFAQWIEELGRSPEDAQYLHIEHGMEEVPTDSGYTALIPTDDLTTGITFKDGEAVSRVGKRSDHEIVYVE
jgi:hypothetical protein